MKFIYNRDVSEKTIEKDHTVAYSYQWLPLLLNNCGYAYSFRRFYIEREGLNNYFMLYTHSGKGVMKHGKNEYIYTPGTIVVIDCMEYQYYGTISEEPWEYHYIHFSGSAAKKYYELIGEEKFKLIQAGNNKVIQNLWNELKENAGRQEALVDVKNCALLSQLLAEIITVGREISGDSKGLSRRSEMETAIRWINENYDQKLSVGELAEMVHMSENYFGKLFKKYTGISPYEYLIRQRLYEAKRILRGEDTSVTDVAQMVGFEDSNTFIRCFKKYMGITPLKYRSMGVEGQSELKSLILTDEEEKEDSIGQ